MLTFDGGVVHGVHVYGDELEQPEATDTSARNVQERTELPQQLRRHLLESVISKEFKTDAIQQTIHMVKVRRKPLKSWSVFQQCNGHDSSSCTNQVTVNEQKNSRISIITQFYRKAFRARAGSWCENDGEAEKYHQCTQVFLPIYMYVWF